MQNQGAVVSEPKTFTKTQASFRIYKSRKTNDGAASEFKLTKDSDKRFNNVALYLSMAPQTGTDSDGNASFDWVTFDNGTRNPSRSIAFKLGLPDIGALLTVLTGLRAGVGIPDGDKFKGLFHQSDNAQTTLQFTVWVNNNVLQGYNLELGTKAKDGKDWNRVKHLVSVEEGEILRNILQSAVLQMTNWQL